MRRIKSKEESLQIAVSKYLLMAYPGVIFTAESSGIRLTMGQAVKAKKQRSQRGLPDLMIFKARWGFNGLLIELKKEGQSPFKLKDGELKAGDHLREQAKAIKDLRREGYHACFCTGFDEARNVIDLYMGKGPTPFYPKAGPS